MYGCCQGWEIERLCIVTENELSAIHLAAHMPCESFLLSQVFYEYIRCGAVACTLRFGVSQLRWTSGSVSL